MKLISKKTLSIIVAAMSMGTVAAQTLQPADFSFQQPATVSADAAKAPLQAVADDEDLMTLGWCMEAWGQTMQVQREKDDVYAHQVHVAAFFPKEVLSKFEGDQIKYVDFAVEPKQGSRVMVFVASDLKNQVYLASGSTTEWEEGWNRCALSTPYTITGNEDLYVGYEVFIGENESMITCTYDNSLDGVQGYNWYGADNDWYALPVNQVPGNFRVRAIIDGDNKPNYDVALERLTSNEDYVEQNKGTWAPTLRVRNFGKVPVTSMHIQAKVNGQVVSEADTDEDFELGEGERGSVDISGLKFPDAGTYDVTLTITKVNGQDDPDMSDNSYNHTIFCYSEGAQTFKHNVLVEQFTAEYYDQADKADALYASVLDKRNDVVWVKHHTSYKGVPDDYTCEGETVYENLYGGARKFVPAICADRQIFAGQEDPGPAYFIDNEDDMEGIVNGAKSQVTFANLDVKVSKSADGKTITATVDGTSSTPKLQQQSDLRLTVWLVEDGIKSTTQEGRDEYIQNGVLRKLVTDAWGEQVDVTTGSFSRSYNIDVKDGWNTDKMRVVAFLSNYDSSNIKNCRVYNSAQTAVNPATAISDINADAAPMLVCKDGKVVCVGNGYEVKDVCDVAGRTVANENLQKGLYVVRVSNGKSELTQKLLVK